MWEIVKKMLKKTKLPGVPDCASINACFKIGTMSLILVTVAVNLHNGLNNAIWSISCNAPLPSFCKWELDNSSKLTFFYSFIIKLKYYLRN